jgi:hypothetical protein
MPLVRGLLAICLLFASTSFRFSTAPLEGRWVCMTKSGQVNPDLKYTLNCSGEIIFWKNNHFESTCTDALFPTGSKWLLDGSQLHLTDSEGTLFMTYQWLMPTERTLQLERKGVVYEFERAPQPVQARN